MSPFGVTPQKRLQPEGKPPRQCNIMARLYGNFEYDGESNGRRDGSAGAEQSAAGSQLYTVQILPMHCQWLFSLWMQYLLTTKHHKAKPQGFQPALKSSRAPTPRCLPRSKSIQFLTYRVRKKAERTHGSCRAMDSALSVQTERSVFGRGGCCGARLIRAEIWCVFPGNLEELKSLKGKSREGRGLRGETFRDKVPSAQRFLPSLHAKRTRSADDKGHQKETRKGNGEIGIKEE